MNISVKHISDSRVELTIVVEADGLSDAEQVALAKLAKSTKIAGFRKGRAPVSVIKKHVDGAQLAQETLENTISKAVAEAFITKDIHVLERPEVEVKKYVPGELLEFAATADILPEVKLGNYKKLTVSKVDTTITKADIDEVIERVRRGFATKSESDQPAGDGDDVVIDFIGKKDSKPFDGGTAEGYELGLGSKSFIPGFEEAIVGHTAGESFSIPLTFPAEYHSKELAGQDVVFDVTIKKVNKVTLPEPDDEFAAKVGEFTDMAALRDDIKSELTAQKEREGRDKQKDEMVKLLVEKSTVSAPSVLVEDQVRSLEQDLTQNLAYQGSTFEQYLASKSYKDREEWIEKEAREAAELRVKAGMVLAALSKEMKIEASDKEIAAEVDRYKSQYAQNPEMAKRFDEPEIQRELGNRIVTDKALNELLALNTKK